MSLTIKDLKKFLLTLPEEFDDYEMINGEFGSGPDNEFYYRLDKPILNLYVDEENKELCFLHQTEEEVDKIENEVKPKETLPEVDPNKIIENRLLNDIR